MKTIKNIKKNKIVENIKNNKKNYKPTKNNKSNSKKILKNIKYHKNIKNHKNNTNIKNIPNNKKSTKSIMVKEISQFDVIINTINKYKNIKKNPYYVYLIECEGDKLYTGITTDINRRFKEHLDRGSSRKGAKFTKLNAPIKIKAYFRMKNRSIATSIEHKIKKLTKDKKLLICKLGENK